MCRQSATVCLIKSPSRAAREVPLLTQRLTALPDPRGRGGRRRALAAVLRTAACAVPAGARSYLAIGQWARHAPQHTLARLGVHAHGPSACEPRRPPPRCAGYWSRSAPAALADLQGNDPRRD
ncbi:hypothetical protein P3T37_000344 [Kitasatospora sp. MAA4]|uniref:transposase family protein n=1 Tax=Kitasatospora sp. MAA4 TaxID=3035093 RepID=UPI002475C444|nr:transposase family protein [Kitasatospora sp. MAA4]MDH6130977.1 hypothetical protein [Kitasatospora sp. MAA4]